MGSYRQHPDFSAFDQKSREMGTPSQHEASSSYPTPPLTATRSYIREKAIDFLAPTELNGFANIIRDVCHGKERDEDVEPSKRIYEAFAQHFPNLLVIKLLLLSRFATKVRIRSFSLNLLETHLINLEESKVSLKKDCLDDIKILLIARVYQETSDDDFKLLSSIISRVAVGVFMDSNTWQELCSYIIRQNFDRKSLLIFKELPTLLDEEFLMKLLQYRIDSMIVYMLASQNSTDEEWCLALEAAFCLMLQLINLGKKSLVSDMVYLIVTSIRVMVNWRRREILARKGLAKIARKVEREALRFRKPDFEAVSLLAMMIETINGVGEVTKMIIKEINEVLER